MTAVWTANRTWVDGEIVTASMMNQYLRDNLDYLKERPYAQETDYDSAADFTTTSTSFVDTTISESITTTASGRVEVHFWCLQNNSGANTNTFDIAVDGTRQGDVTVGMFQDTGLSPSRGQPAISRIITGLSAGAHTIAIYWKTTAGTASIYQYGLTVKEV